MWLACGRTEGGYCPTCHHRNFVRGLLAFLCPTETLSKVASAYENHLAFGFATQPFTNMLLLQKSIRDEICKWLHTSWHIKKIMFYSVIGLKALFCTGQLGPKVMCNVRFSVSLSIVGLSNIIWEACETFLSFAFLLTKRNVNQKNNRGSY